MSLSNIKSTLTSADIIDVQALIAAYEQAIEDEDTQGAQEYFEILDELRGEGGDVQYRGEWYPSTLIRDRCFNAYARELVEDCGDLPRDRMDYSCIDIDGDTYWYR